MQNTPHILVTRPAGQSERLITLLTQAGYIATHFPLLTLEPDAIALGLLNEQAQTANWLVFVSPSAIDFAWPALACADLSHTRLACVGPSSALHLSRLSGRTVLYPPQGNDSESLLALPDLAYMHNQSVLIIRGHGGRELLGQTLIQRGAKVQFAECYRRLDGSPDWNIFDNRPADAIVLTSTSMVEQLFRLAGLSRQTALQSLVYCVPHPRISEQLAQRGITRIITTQADDVLLVNGLNQWFSRYL